MDEVVGADRGGFASGTTREAVQVEDVKRELGVGRDLHDGESSCLIGLPSHRTLGDNETDEEGRVSQISDTTMWRALYHVGGGEGV